MLTWTVRVYFMYTSVIHEPPNTCLTPNLLCLSWSHNAALQCILQSQNVHIIRRINKWELPTLNRRYPIKLSLVVLPQRIKRDDLPLKQLLRFAQTPLRRTAFVYFLLGKDIRVLFVDR